MTVLNPPQIALDFLSVVWMPHPEPVMYQMRVIRSEVDQCFTLLNDAYMYAPAIREALMVRGVARLVTLYVQYVEMRRAAVINGLAQSDSFPDVPVSIGEGMVDIMREELFVPATPSPTTASQSHARNRTEPEAEPM